MKILKSVCLALVSLLAATGLHAQNRAIMEGIPASNNTVFVATQPVVLIIGATYYTGSLPTGSLAVKGTVSANLYKGDGSQLTGITVAGILPSTVAYTDKANVFTSSQIFVNGILVQRSTLTVNGPIISTGTTGGVVFSGAGTRFEWIPSSGAMRAGVATSTEWDAANIGVASMALGKTVKASGTSSTVSGGQSNTASGSNDTVGGGSGNTASGGNATVPGGVGNLASGLDSFAAGNNAKARHNGSFVWGDSQSTGYNSRAADSFSIGAHGGVWIDSGTLNVSGNVTAPNFVGNGSLLTGIVTAGANTSITSIESANVGSFMGSSVTWHPADVTTGGGILDLAAGNNVDGLGVITQRGGHIQLTGGNSYRGGSVNMWTGGTDYPGDTNGSFNFTIFPGGLDDGAFNFIGGPIRGDGSQLSGISLSTHVQTGMTWVSSRPYIGSELVNSDSQWVAAPVDDNDDHDYRGVAISADGSSQTVVAISSKIFTSSDFGRSWTSRDSNRLWTGIAMSHDAHYQVAVASGSQIRVSSDYGVTWTAKDSSRHWAAVRASADGQYMTAVVRVGDIYYSSDFGATWSAAGVSGHAWIGVAMSDNGQYQTAADGPQDPGDEGSLYRSEDFGVTWTLVQAAGSSDQFIAVAMQGNGEIQYAIHDYMGIMISTDFGHSFSCKYVRGYPNCGGHSYNDIAVAGDYVYLSGSGSGTLTVYKPDEDRLWDSENFISDYIAASADGYYVTAVSGGQRQEGADPGSVSPGSHGIHHQPDRIRGGVTVLDDYLNPGEGILEAYGIRLPGNLSISGEIIWPSFYRRISIGSSQQNLDVDHVSVGYENYSNDSSLVVGGFNYSNYDSTPERPVSGSSRNSIFGWDNQIANGTNYGTAIGEGNFVGRATFDGEAANKGTAIGYNNYVFGGDNQTAVGSNNTSSGTLNSVFGEDNHIVCNTDNPGSLCGSNTSLGIQNNSLNIRNTVVVGQDNRTSGLQSVIVGVNNYSYNNGSSIMLASRSTSTVTGMTIGFDLFNSTGNAVVIGMNMGTALTISPTGGVALQRRTIAQLLTITPTYEGEQFYCSNCSPKKTVVSTGTATGNWAAADGGAFQ